MDVREKLVEQTLKGGEKSICPKCFHYVVCRAIENQPCIKCNQFVNATGVTVQECCHKAESVISKTGLMCTACHSDIDHDAVFCQYCGAKVMPQPPKGE